MMGLQGTSYGAKCIVMAEVALSSFNKIVQQEEVGGVDDDSTTYY